MQKRLQAIYPVGTLLRSRYRIESLLGKGGFGAVYLVKDQQEGGSFIALKELREQNEDEKNRLLFESDILKRLDHRSLPKVRGVFEENDRFYMLMDYIEGPNLEVLRKKQPGRVFSFVEVLAMLQPISEALSYLHQQNPPLIHRDIKPSNIVVPKNGAGTFLVDFGIAREYQADATTTAIRHCSPGYSSPEQYSGMGTSPRADVYGLAATCYTLLSGSPPADALQRLTKVASKHPDLLVPLHDLYATIPVRASQTIQRGLALNQERRFATTEEFWEALRGEGEEEDFSSEQVQTDPAIFLPEEKKSHSLTFRRKKLWVPVVVLLLFLVAGLVGGFWFYSPSFSSAPQTHVGATSTQRPVPTSAASVDYPLLVSTYEGTLNNLLTHATDSISFASIHQNSQTVMGVFNENHALHSRPFSGVVDVSKHVLLTVEGQTNQAALFFDGVVHDDGSIVGNYCSVDTSSGQCAGGEYGLWSVTP